VQRDSATRVNGNEHAQNTIAFPTVFAEFNYHLLRPPDAPRLSWADRDLFMLRRRAVPAPAVHWSKDFVEHLRSVHFALIAVSIGLILILSRANTPALSQIRQIVELKKQWPPEWLGDVVQTKELSLQNCDRRPPPLALPPDPWSMSWKHDRLVRGEVEGGKAGSTRRNFVVHFAFPDHNWLESPIAGSSLAFEFPTTLSGFRDWWSQLETTHRAYFPTVLCDVGHAASMFGEPEQPAIFLLPEYASGISHNSNEDRILPLTLESNGEEGRFAYRAFDPERGLYYSLPVASLKVVNLWQGTLVDGTREFRGWGWRKGSFERSFAALVSETRGIEAEDLEEVEKILAERLAKNSEEFEAFGMKFPIAQITEWGTLALLGVQLYFFL
jgi:hypothetical protein